MDQMIYILQMSLGRRKVAPSALEKVGHYLMGNATLESATRYLPKQAFLYYDARSYVREIADACRKQPDTILPRTGRFLDLALEIEGSLYPNLVGQFLGFLSPEQLFFDTGHGPEAMAAYFFRYGQVREKTAEALELLDTRAPGTLEAYVEYANVLQSLLPLSWLAGQRGFDLSFQKKKKSLFSGKTTGTLEERLTHSLLLVAGAIAKDWKSFPAFEEALGERCPQALDCLPSPEEYAKWAAGSQYQRSSLQLHIYHALTLSGGELPHFNAVIASLCQADSSSFMEGLFLFLQKANDKASEEDRTAQAVRFLKKIDVDRAYLCAWLEEKRLYQPKEWTSPLMNLYQDDSLLPKVLQVGSPLAKASAARALGRSEEGAELAIGLFQHHASNLSKPEELMPVIDWLRQGVGQPEALSPLEDFYDSINRRYRPVPPFYDADYAIWCSVDQHPVAQRYLAYLTSRPLSRGLGAAASFMVDTLGKSPDETARYMMDSADHAALIGGLSDTAQVQEATSGPILRVFLACVDLDPAAAVSAMEKAEAAGRMALLEAVYRAHPDYDSSFLLACLADKSKKVREMTYNYLLPKKELLEDVRELTNARKKDVREAAQRLVAAYEGSEDVDGETGDLMALCAKLVPSTATNSLRWAFPGGLPSVRRREGDEPAEEALVKAYFYLMLGSKTLEMHPAAPAIREALREEDLAEVAAQVYHQWLSDGAPAKQKVALLPYCVHASDSDILALQKQIEQWAQSSRGAIASDAVRTMIYSGSDLALMTVDSIGRKFKNKQVRRAGQEAFSQAATALGVDAEVLGDRIIPTLGFDQRGEKIIDYGSRQFTAILSPQLTIEMQDDKGKRIKSLPKPGAKDDIPKAEAAKKDFTALKKSLKAVVTTQSQRLELALATGRRWDGPAWQKLFVQNPIMHSFAIGLVWGVYDGDTLREAFRYLEDGSFTNVEEDDFQLDSLGDGNIGLVHPLDLTQEQREQWKEQLEDYDVTQPISQIGRAIYRMTKEEEAAFTIDRFCGKKMLGISLMGKLQKSGWYKGSVQDGGGFYTFYREIETVGVQLNFSGMYVSPDPTEEIIIGQAVFYQAGAVQRGSYIYDDVNKNTVIPLSQISPRMFSEIILDLEAATAASTESIPDWKHEVSVLTFPEKG